MEDKTNLSGKSLFNPLQPVQELIEGADADIVCMKYGISRTQLVEMFRSYQDSKHETAVTSALTASKTGRNDPCPCGSGKKYKKCCMPVHEEALKRMPKEEVRQMEERARALEKLEKEVKKGFELLFVQEYERAEKYAAKQIETFPEDDRFHDVLVSACLGRGDYEAAFRIAQKRWQTAVEDKAFFQTNGFHKGQEPDRDRHVNFFSPSTWLEKFWIAQRALAWQGKYPPGSGSPQVAGNVKRLQTANDLKLFPGKQEEGFEARKAALMPVLEKIQSDGVAAIPFLLPLTYNFNWAALFVPGLLHAWNTDECVQLLAELSMFRYPYFSPKCLECLEQTGEPAVPVISLVMEENSAFDELKAGLLKVLGNVVCDKSFEILAKFTEHENLYVATRAVEALEKHNNPDALPYIEKTRKRVASSDQIAGVVKEIMDLKGRG